MYRFLSQCRVGTREAQAVGKVAVALAARLEGGRIAGYRLAAGSADQGTTA